MQAREPLSWAALVAILLLVVFADVPGSAHGSSVLQNAAHAPAFALLFLLIVRWIKPRSRDLRSAVPGTVPLRSVVRVAFVSVAIAVLLGLCTEALQWLMGRDAELEDLLQDALGASAAAMPWIYRHSPRTPAEPRRAPRCFWLLIGGVCAALWFLPLVTCAIAYLDRAENFPVLGKFATPRDLYFTEMRGGPARLVPAGVTRSGVLLDPGLEITLQGDSWPGVTLNEPQPNWRSYRVLVVEVSTPGPRPLQVNVRVDDSEEWNAEDSFTGTFLCEADNRCEHSFALESLQTPGHRPLDLGNISRVVVFHSGPLPDQPLRVHRVRLAR